MFPTAFALLPLLLHCSNGIIWTHSTVLDRDNNFHLFWIPGDEIITFEIQVRTKGYVALGFSPTGGMRGADIVIGWVDSEKIILQDRFASDTTSPHMDASQDYKLLWGYENDTHTVLRFSRPWLACGDGEDFPLSGDTTRVIWAYHPDDPPFPTMGPLTYHGHTRRGTRSLYLKETGHNKLDPKEPRVKTWELLADNMPLPEDDHTHYWCRIFQAPPMDKKHQIIGFEPIIQPGHESYLHHMVLYECHVPNEASASPWFAHHVEAKGERCYSPNMPPEWTFCLATNTLAWAVGSEGETLPAHVGIPLGEQHGGGTFFMLETHYDNPAFHKGIRDNSGLRIFYTDDVRRHDTGMLLLGSEVNFLHMIPPRQDNFTTAGRCTSACTEEGLGPGGIRVLNGVLHSHLAGRKVRLRHVRNGKELPVILEDHHYDFNFQASREPDPKETLVLPGDDLIMECQYETTTRDRPTFGGLSTREEMCLGFILYYPRKKLADCRSLPTLETVMYAFGIESIYGKSFEKLAAFLKDIGGSDHSDGKALEDLLHILALETGRDVSPLTRRTNNILDRAPLTEADLLSRPFYTVASEEEDSGPTTPPPDLPSSQSLKAMSETDYRNFLSEMLLSIRIQSPEQYHNMTIGDRMLNMSWRDREVASKVEEILMYGPHNSLCLAHGRDPLLPYEPAQYPFIDPVNPQLPALNVDEDNRCLQKRLDRFGLKSFQLGDHPESSKCNNIKGSNTIFVLLLVYASMSDMR